MDIYLTNLTTSDRLRFPMLPTEISVKLANQFGNYTILNIGEVKIPSGTALDSISWNGIFPGERRKKAPYVFDWQDPKAIYRWIDNLKTQHGKPVKARLLITETPINCDVYLSSFTGTPTGGYGDINYSIALIQAKDIRISTDTAATPTTLNHSATMAERTTPKKEETYTIASGDSLWKIAQKVYGKGSDYTRLYEANKDVVGSNPNLIRPGQVLTIP
mgnify:FL=1